MIIKKRIYPCQIVVEKTYSKDDLGKIEEKILKAECGRIKIPGFRPGAAPSAKVRELLQADREWEKLLGIKLQEELISDWGKEKETEFGEIVKILKLEVLKSEPLTLQCHFEYFPRLTKKELGEKYKNLEIKKENSFKDIRASKEEIENGIKELQKRRTVLQPVEEPLGKEKSAFIKICPLAKKGGTAGEKEKKDLFHWGIEQYGKEFDKETEGMKEGEKKIIDLGKIKDKEIEKIKSGNGEKSKLEIRVEKVFMSKIPKINDEFARSLGKFKNLEELKSSLGRGMNLEKLYQERDRRKEALLNVLLESISLELPDSIVRNSASKYKESFIEHIKNSPQHTIHSHDTAHLHEKKQRDKEEKMNKIFRERAEKELKLQRILEAVALEEKIVPGVKETEEEIHKILRSFSSPKEARKAFGSVENLRSRVTLSLCFEKTMRFLEKKNDLFEDIDKEIEKLEKETD